MLGRISWEAFPQRKRKKRDRSKVECNDSNSSITDTNNDSSSDSMSNTNEDKLLNENQQQQNYRKVEENLIARSKIKRAESKLSDKDGCAGEFYEYLDHTADVQCHSWGKTIIEAFENMAPCMFNYMTDLSTVEIDVNKTIEFTVIAHDLQSLLFAYMDEMLFRFCTDGFVIVKLQIVKYNKDNNELLCKA